MPSGGGIMEATGANGDSNCLCVTSGSQQKQYLGMIYVLGDCQVMIREFWWLLACLAFCVVCFRKRRGAINSKQLTYLEKYRSKQRLRFKDSHSHKNKCCTMWTYNNRHTHKDVLYISTDPLRNLTTQALCHCHKQCTPVIFFKDHYICNFAK